jgi:hypothetical protein
MAAMLTLLAVALTGAVPAATVVTLLVEDDGTTDPGTLGELTGTDSDPNALGWLSSGSYVYFESESGAPVGVSDSLFLFDPTQTNLARFTLLADEATLLSTAGITGNLACNGIAIDPDTDDVYAMIQELGSDDFHIIRIPSSGLGTDTFGAPVLVNSIGVFPALASMSQVDTTTSPSSLIIMMDDDNINNDATTNGVYRLPVNATPSDTPTLIATFGELAAGTTPPTAPVTDFIGFRSPVALQAGSNAGDILMCNGIANAGPEEGDIVRWDPDTNTASIFVEAPSQSISPMVAMDDGTVLIWNVGGNNNVPPDPEDILLFDNDGSPLGVFTSDLQLTNAISNSPDNLALSNYSFAGNGVDVFAVFTSLNNESLLEMTIPPTSPVGDWALYR